MPLTCLVSFDNDKSLKNRLIQFLLNFNHVEINVVSKAISMPLKPESKKKKESCKCSQKARC